MKLNTNKQIDDVEALNAAVTEYNTEMLGRGKNSVRFSRQSYEEVKKKAEDRQAFLAPIKPITETDVVLEVEVKA